MHAFFLHILLSEAFAEYFNSFWVFCPHFWVLRLSYLRQEILRFLEWEKWILWGGKSLWWSLFSWQISLCFQEYFASFTMITFLLFQPELWGLRQQESFFTLYHHMLVKLLEVKPMKVKPMNLWEVKHTKSGGLHLSGVSHSHPSPY